MVSVKVSRMGKTNTIFVDPDAKVNSLYYCRFVLGKGLLPDIQARCHQHKWTYQQDGASAHSARNITDYLKKEKIDFIGPDSPNLNPVDYAVWGPFSRVYHGQKFNTVEKLKQPITSDWKKTVATFY